MAIELECSICGQEHRFRDEHAGRKTRCKECTARIDIPRGGLGGILDGTTPVFTPPVILVGSFLSAALLLIVVWELAGSSRPSTVPTQPVARSAPLPTLPRTTSAVPNLPARPTETQVPSVTSPFPANPTPMASAIDSNRPTPPSSNPTTSAAGNPVGRSQPARPGSASGDEKARILRVYEARRIPLVAFETSADQPIRIQNIAPAWAEPGQAITLRGTGLSKATRVLAIDSIRFREYELTHRPISDSELVISAPPDCERRSECVFVIEVHTPDGVAVTFPKELADVSDTVLEDFAIIRRRQIPVASVAFALVDELGGIQTVNTTRIYLLKPTQSQVFRGVASKLLQTDQSDVGPPSGAALEVVTVPAIFPCHVDQMFVGPQCRIRRLLFH